MKGIEKITPEYKEQSLFVQWCKFQPKIKDLIFCIPNGGNNSVQWNCKLKKMGLRAGVSDIFIPLPTKKYHGLWIEMKRSKSSTKSPKQISWVNKMNTLDYSAHFAHGFNEAKNITIEYLKTL